MVDLLHFGFPLDHNNITGSNVIPSNHTGVRDFPKQIHAILEKEIKTGATIGPFSYSPFGDNICISPPNSVPKKDSKVRRLILDLSFPQGNSVNDGIEKDCYLGEYGKMVLPSVDDLVNRIMKLRRGCKVWKIDLSRAYRQIFLCPGSINRVAFCFDGYYFFDTTLSMGSRSSARYCQRVTSAVVYIFRKWGFFAINYLDDLGSAEEESRAELSYYTLLELLHTIGLKEATNKCSPPNTVMIFLGIQVDTLC